MLSPDQFKINLSKIIHDHMTGDANPDRIDGLMYEYTQMHDWWLKYKLSEHAMEQEREKLRRDRQQTQKYIEITEKEIRDIQNAICQEPIASGVIMRPEHLWIEDKCAYCGKESMIK